MKEHIEYHCEKLLEYSRRQEWIYVSKKYICDVILLHRDDITSILDMSIDAYYDRVLWECEVGSSHLSRLQKQDFCNQSQATKMFNSKIRIFASMLMLTS